MKRIGFLLFLVLLFSGCAATKAYQDVMNEEAIKYNMRTFLTSKEIVTLALTKAILAKKFVIESEDKDAGIFVASRYFNKGKRNVVLALQTKIIKESENTTTVYLNAIETTERNYITDKTRFFMWVVPLPGGGGKEATKIKESEEVIEDEKFYNSLFELVNSYMPDK